MEDCGHIPLAFQGGSLGKGQNQASLKWKAPTHTGDPNLWQTLNSEAGAKYLNTRDCALVQTIWIDNEDIGLATQVQVQFSSFGQSEILIHEDSH